MTGAAFLVIGLALSGVAVQAQGVDVDGVKTCKALSPVGPGFGVAYRGTVYNDDYHLRLDIPRGLTGWGAAPEAPFHGFVIFLPDRGSHSACIVFEIHLRLEFVERGSERTEPGPVATVRIGNIRGVQRERKGEVDGATLRNVLISFSVPQDRRTVDGSVWFITPVSDSKKNDDLFRRFISSVRFGAEG